MRRGTRLAIYLRDGLLCLYCLRDLHGADPRDITLDHVIAHADGGTHAASNLITACRACNCSRQDLTLAFFAGRETRSHIRRNCKRALAPYRRLATAILDGTMDQGDVLAEMR